MPLLYPPHERSAEFLDGFATGLQFIAAVESERARWLADMATKYPLGFPARDASLAQRLAESYYEAARWAADSARRTHVAEAETLRRWMEEPF